MLRGLDFSDEKKRNSLDSHQEKDLKNRGLYGSTRQCIAESSASAMPKHWRKKVYRDLIQSVRKVNAVSPAQTRFKLFVGVEMQVAPFGIGKLAPGPSRASRIFETVMTQVAVVVETLNRSAGANTGARLVTMYSHLLRTQLHIVNAFAIEAFALANEVVVVAECVRVNLLKLGLIRNLGWSVGWVLRGRIYSVTIGVEKHRLGHLLRFRRNIDILETFRATGFSVADRDSPIS